MQQILAFGGSGYFPERLVRRYLEAGELHELPGSPQFRLPAWMVFPRDNESTSLNWALDGLRTLAREEAARS